MYVYTFHVVFKLKMKSTNELVYKNKSSHNFENISFQFNLYLKNI